MLGNGRSGIIGGLVDGSDRNFALERISFIAGRIILPLVVVQFWDHTATNVSSNFAILIAAGLLVGIGTRIANGCTTGRGVYGISSLSLRGMDVTVFYILAGGLSVVLFRHILGIIYYAIF